MRDRNALKGAMILANPLEFSKADIATCTLQRLSREMLLRTMMGKEEDEGQELGSYGTIPAL